MMISVKNTVLLLLFIFSYSLVKGQNISDLETGKIVELESIQSSISGTFIVSAMQRSADFSTKVMIYRSTDNANSWTVIDSILPNPGSSEIPDPVLATDTVGNFFLAVMRVNNNPNPSSITSDVEIYKSIDDGLTWTLTGVPHFSDSIADYPQLLAKDNGELFLTYSYMRGFPAISNSSLHFQRSSDGGITWTTAIALGEDSIKCIGADISRAHNSKLLISVGSMDSSCVYTFESSDFGTSWNSLNRFELPNNEKVHITKPLTHPNLSFYGIISHKPHQEESAIVYHAVINGQQYTQIVDSGAYAQGHITDNGTVHLVYSKKVNNRFTLFYTKSTDSGITFQAPLTLYSQDYTTSASGEYQSLILGIDQLFYLTFCDWSDNSKAKTLIFDPQSISLDVDLISNNSAIQLFPNPVADAFSIKFQNQEACTTVRLMNTSGQIVKTWEGINAMKTEKFDISDLQKASYLILIEGENRIYVQRIVKSN